MGGQTIRIGQELELREAAAHAWRSSEPGLSESDGELEHVRRAVALIAAVVHTRLHCSRPPARL